MPSPDGETVFETTVNSVWQLVISALVLHRHLSYRQVVLADFSHDF